MTDERSLGRFLRGLTIGALIGAIVAGSRLWSRRAAGPSADVVDPPGTPPAIPPQT